MVSTLLSARRPLAISFAGINQCRRLATTHSLQQIRDSETTEANQGETTSLSPLEPICGPPIRKLFIMDQIPKPRRVRGKQSHILLDQPVERIKDMPRTISQLSSTLQKFTLAGKVAVVTRCVHLVGRNSDIRKTNLSRRFPAMCFAIVGASFLSINFLFLFL